MSGGTRIVVLYAVMAALIVAAGVVQSWVVALTILNLCLISAVMALGVNIQWGYAGPLQHRHHGVRGPRRRRRRCWCRCRRCRGRFRPGGGTSGLAALAVVGTVGAALFVRDQAPAGLRGPLGLLTVAGRILRDAAVPRPGVGGDRGDRPGLGRLSRRARAADPAVWLVGGLFAAGAAYLVGKLTLGLRSDYLAIATLGIAEIVLAILKNENWLTRGVKNVTGLLRPIPDERVLQQAAWVQDLAARFGAGRGADGGRGLAHRLRAAVHGGARRRAVAARSRRCARRGGG